MPAISRFYGIVIFMNYDDHLPRHFHARYGEHKASIRIADGTVLDGSLPGRALRLIEGVASTAPRGAGGELAALRNAAALLADSPAVIQFVPMKLGNIVLEASPLGGHRLRVKFADGFVGETDLKSLPLHRRGPLVQALREEGFFQRVSVDEDCGVVAWPNGYDICADVLRRYCELGRACPEPELTAFFAPQAEELMLNDKPIP